MLAGIRTVTDRLKFRTIAFVCLFVYLCLFIWLVCFVVGFSGGGDGGGGDGYQFAVVIHSLSDGSVLI